MSVKPAAARIASAADFQKLLDAAAPPLGAAIATIAATAPAVWWEVLERCPDLAVWVAANRTVPGELLEHLAGHPRIPVRVAVASNPGLAERVMMQLAHDKSDLVRMRIACNASTSREVLATLVADPCVVVCAHAQARLRHDISGVTLPASYLDEVSVFDILH